MNRLVSLATAAAIVAAAGAGLLHTRADAQDAPRQGMMGERHPAMDGPGGMGEREGMQGRGMERDGMRGQGMWMRRMRQFALVYPATDRNLSGADVQKIAEAFLLFNGNHSWKVSDVAETPGQVTFAFATPDGTAIAHFAMDRHTGRPERVD